jgi:hypothetical protein
MGTKLEVHTNSAKYTRNPEGFKSTDQCAVALKAFCDLHGIPYSDVFVSIAVSLEGSNVKKVGPGRTAVKYQLAEAYGKNILTLKSDVMKEIEVVCTGDFQTTICNAVAKRLRGDDISEYLSKLAVLSGKTVEEKMAALEKAAANVRSPQYAEARIHRPLRKIDVAARAQSSRR